MKPSIGKYGRRAVELISGVVYRLFPLLKPRHFILWKDVSPHIKTRSDAYSESISYVAIYLLFCFRLKAWSWKCRSSSKYSLLIQVTAQFQRDVGKYSTEYIVSSDDLLIGFRGLWNFGAEPRISESPDLVPSSTTNDADDVLSPPINGPL